MKKLLATSNDWTGFIIRVTLGLVMFPHGAQKLFGWFGGHGFAATISFMNEKLGLPPAIAILVILGESLGAIALMAGFFSRFMAFGMAIIMIGAVGMVHLPHGFFMNWFGNQQGEGFEYHLLVIGLSLAVMIHGSGRLSIDRLLMGKCCSTAGQEKKGQCCPH